MSKLNTFSITLMLSAAAVAGFLAFSYFSAHPTEEQRPAGTVSLEPETKLRPTFSLSDPDGARVSSQQWDGKPLVINFWATWCAPCRREIPLLKSLVARHSDKDLQVVGVALDFPDAVSEYANSMEIDYPILVGDQDAMDVAKAFGLDLIVLPATAVSDSSGHVVTVHIGELRADQADIILEILWRIEAGETTRRDGREEIERRLKALREATVARN